MAVADLAEMAEAEVMEADIPTAGRVDEPAVVIPVVVADIPAVAVVILEAAGRVVAVVLQRKSQKSSKFSF